MAFSDDTYMSYPGSTLTFEHLSYEVVRKKDVRLLVDDVSVRVNSGELLAIMGPSGSGKSTLLDLMSFRKIALSGAAISLNGKLLNAKTMFKISAYVEQDDALLGVLTVRETVAYTLRLYSPRMASRDVYSRVDRVLDAFGLTSCQDQRIGTPISRGLSGGQKRRVTAACAVVVFPRILFLDEITSGLDSTSAREVIASIRKLAIEEGIIVLAAIHQPSLQTLNQFAKVLLLSKGKLCFAGRADELEVFFERWGRPVPRFSTPSDHAMDFLNEDFAGFNEYGMSGAQALREFYLSTVPLRVKRIDYDIFEVQVSADPDEHDRKSMTGDICRKTAVLSERAAINYSRNILAYGVRAGMYAGMGFMLATIWIRLGDSDSTINDRLSVHFYAVAFLAFMSVAGIPSFIEERLVFDRERKNGLYTTLPFVLSNTLVNAPFLFLCAFFFSVICYWAIGLHPGGAAFFRFLVFLLLATLAAESQVLVVVSLIPAFVPALAISAFLNGFWMSVGGYFIKARSLPRFWYYTFHYIDYQRYSFELLANSDLRNLIFRCTPSEDMATCSCAYPSSGPDPCAVSGDDVLTYLDIRSINYAKWIGILVSINVIYRICLYIALRLRLK